MEAAPEPLPEPWMRGPIEGVDPLLAPVLYSFQMAREDLGKYTDALSIRQLCLTPYSLASVAFHLLHIAGSTDRLVTYLQDKELTPTQLDALAAEQSPGEWTRDQLLNALDQAFFRAETVIRAIHPDTLADPRTVGRKRLPTTVAGLLTHIAEHTQRHVGQAIASAKLSALL